MRRRRFRRLYTDAGTRPERTGTSERVPVTRHTGRWSKSAISVRGVAKLLAARIRCTPKGFRRSERARRRMCDGETSIRAFSGRVRRRKSTPTSRASHTDAMTMRDVAHRFHTSSRLLRPLRASVHRQISPFRCAAPASAATDFSAARRTRPPAHLDLPRRRRRRFCINIVHLRASADSPHASATRASTNSRR